MTEWITIEQARREFQFSDSHLAKHIKAKRVRCIKEKLDSGFIYKLSEQDLLEHVSKKDAKIAKTESKKQLKRDAGLVGFGALASEALGFISKQVQEVVSELDGLNATSTETHGHDHTQSTSPQSNEVTGKKPKERFIVAGLKDFLNSSELSPAEFAKQCELSRSTIVRARAMKEISYSSAQKIVRCSKKISKQSAKNLTPLLMRDRSSDT